MLSPELEADTAAEDTAPSTPDGIESTPASIDVLEEVRLEQFPSVHDAGKFCGRGMPFCTPTLC